jgi:hypothetical protein
LRTCKSRFSGMINTWLGSISKLSVIRSTGKVVNRGRHTCEVIYDDDGRSHISRKILQ